MLTVLWHCVTRYSTNICTQYDLLCAVCFKIVSHSDLGQTLSESPTPNRLFISGWCQRAPGWYRGWASGKCCIQRWVFVWRPFVAFSALSHLHYCRLGMPSSPDYNDSSYYSLAFFFKMTVVETPALQLFFFSRPNSLWCQSWLSYFRFMKHKRTRFEANRLWPLVFNFRLLVTEHNSAQFFLIRYFSFLPPQLYQWKQLENLYFREKKFAVEVNDPHRWFFFSCNPGPTVYTINLVSLFSIYLMASFMPLAAFTNNENMSSIWLKSMLKTVFW